MAVITPIPAFEDNYIWMISDPGGTTAAVVDPGDEDPVLEALEHAGLSLGAILVTHKHGDHVGGVMALREAFPDCEVYGPAGEPIRGLTRTLESGDRVMPPGIDVSYRVMLVPGHTEGHIAYFGDNILFCGDTLFAAGCGRVFSGTHAQLHDSLQLISGLPADTLVYCAHEYTLANIGFARWVEPDSPAVQARLEAAEAMRARDEPTVPSLLSLELETNPFLRTAEPVVIRAAEKYTGKALSGGADVFAAVRNWKDREYD
ncbi:MAG: hydroxyacylglutathione hydrolase [Gammaproteobacteria bacterium]|nr:hydroxyacylglutathione hydrolase [Gammaproteobacteria bacterium]